MDEGFCGSNSILPTTYPPVFHKSALVKLSSRAQKLAAVPEAQFEGMIGEWRERIGKENGLREIGAPGPLVMGDNRLSQSRAQPCPAQKGERSLISRGTR